jgi:hypothetical protein
LRKKIGIGYEARASRSSFMIRFSVVFKAHGFGRECQQKKAVFAQGEFDERQHIVSER